MKRIIRTFLLTALVTPLWGQVTYERLLKARDDAGNWLTFSGAYDSRRYSLLDQITRENVKNLKLKWVFQIPTTEKVEATPIVADGIMYLTQPPSTVFALDPRTGRPFWSSTYPLPELLNVCCGRVNRGVAILGDHLFMTTLDSHVIALDAKSGSIVWDVAMEGAEPHKGYSGTVAPLAVKDKIIVGVAGGEYGIRGFLDAYDAKTGKRAWRFYTIPGPGEPGHETWGGDSWKRGGGSTWVTGSFDPELNLVYWGTGNPSPDYNGDVRPGDNLYTDSVIALDADNGKLKWHFQFTPHDVHDWDAVQIPVLTDIEFRGRQRKVMLWANRNSFFYALDRETGEFLTGKPFVKQSWAKGLDDKGRPIRVPGTLPNSEGALVYPGVQGGTNWYSPSYSPRTKLFYLSVWDYANTYFLGDPTYSQGNRYLGSLPQRLPNDPGSGSIRAIDPQTATVKWTTEIFSKSMGGVLSTAGDVLFGCTDEGHFLALDALTGKELWRASLGGKIANSPITYTLDGKQLVTIAAGSAYFTFELPD